MPDVDTGYIKFRNYQASNMPADTVLVCLMYVVCTNVCMSVSECAHLSDVTTCLCIAISLIGFALCHSMAVRGRILKCSDDFRLMYLSHRKSLNDVHRYL